MYDGGDWGVLDLGQDPVRGDPTNVRALGTFSQNESQHWSEHTESLTTTADYGNSMPMEGDFASKYRDHLGELPGRAAALRDAHEQAGNALAQYAEQLEEAKTESRMALQQGMQAKQQYQQAKAAYDEAVAEENSLPRTVPYEQLPYYEALYERLEAQRMRAWGFMQEAEQMRMAARQRAVMAGESAQRAEGQAAQVVQGAAPKSPADSRGTATAAVAAGGTAALLGGAVAAAQQGSAKTGGGWLPGDPIPPAMTEERFSGRPLRPPYRGEDDPNNPDRHFFPDTVKYMSAQEREAARVFVDGDGKFRWAKDGSLFDTSAAKTFHSGAGRSMFVMDRAGNVYTSMEQKVGYMHHSSFLGGRPVAGAGELVVKDGTLMLLSDKSGHYHPPRGMTYEVLDELRARGVNLNRPDFQTQIVSPA
jgi:hypothetical protein